jgi:hypothetical protein
MQIVVRKKMLFLAPLTHHPPYYARENFTLWSCLNIN